MPWMTFLRAHWETLAAADFFTTEVLTWRGLVRYHMLFVMRLQPREVHLAGITCDRHEGWMLQVARNLTGFDGFLAGVTHLILDRDRLFTGSFRRLLKDSGVKVVRLPRESPNLNAHMERFGRSLKSEALEHFVFFGEGQLRRVVTEFLVHYHGERNHQGLDGKIITPGPEVGRTKGEVRCCKRLGGLLSYYYRYAA